MKVLCIDNKKEIDKNCVGNFKPIEGETYTVLDVVFWYGLNWYQLLEDSGGNGWNMNCFIPLSEISETEMIRNYQTEPA